MEYSFLNSFFWQKQTESIYSFFFGPR
jgi:hypothetical protein